MKKTLIGISVVGVLIIALGVVGYAYAQETTPPAPPSDGEYGTGFGYRGARGRGMMGWDGEYGPLHEVMSAAIADALGISVEELNAAHQAGETAWDIAQEQGLTEDEFRTLMFAARETALEQAVQDGLISQEQADWMQSRWDYMQENGFGPGSENCDGNGPHGRGRKGGSRRW